MPRRCLVVSYYFPPVGGAGVQRIVKLIKYLSRQDWKFTVVTANENSPFQPLDTSQLSELPSELKIINVDTKLPISGKSNLNKLPFLNHTAFWKRWVAAWISIPDIRMKWVAPAQKAIVDELSRLQYDCILVTIPPYSLGSLAANLQAHTSIPVILDLRDPWSLHPYKIHPTVWHYHKNKLLEFRVIKSIKTGTSAYAKLLDYYKDNIPGFDSSRWTFIPNGYDDEDFESLSREKLDEVGFHIGYSGTIHSKINSPEILFKIIADINQNTPKMKNQIYFHHIGKSQISLQKIARKYGIEKQVKLWGYHPHKRALEILNAMDAFLLIHNDNFRNSQYIVAGKVYEYLRLKKPLLGILPEKGEAADLIRQTKSGMVVSAQNKSKIRALLLTWIENVPDFQFENIEIFSREKQANQFSEVFLKAINGENIS